MRTDRGLRKLREFNAQMLMVSTAVMGCHLFEGALRKIECFVRDTDISCFLAARELSQRLGGPAGCVTVLLTAGGPLTEFTFFFAVQLSAVWGANSRPDL